MTFHKKYFSLIIVIISSGILFAQSSSTYTRYGIGDIHYSYSARTLGMGHSGSALISSDFVDVLNPASWSGLDRTRLEISFVFNGVNISNNSQSSFYSDAAFKGITFAFPVSQDYDIGMAMGLVPYSRIDYKAVERREAVGGFSSAHTVTYSGSGGLSKLFFGASYKLPFDVILGATFDYYFGNLKYNSAIVFDDASFYPVSYETLYGPTGYGSTIGLISPDLSGLFNSETITGLRLSASANLINTLNTDTSLTTTSSSLIDTIGIGVTDLKVPYKITIGTAVTLSSQYSFLLDYIYQPWSKFELNEFNQSNLDDVQKVSLGFEYRALKEPGISFWEQIIWRAGLSYEQTQYKFNGKNINQYSAFAGFSLPLSNENTIDFGFEYSSRGTKEANLLKENFMRLNLGISFGDIWFLRYEK